MCLRDKELAKSSVNVLVRELDTADDPCIRSNALVVLGDLCVRYTAIVDRYVGAMAECLQDPHPLVRRHAILLISQLLLQDYIKWRGLLFYRFLATVVDEDQSVRDLGLFTLTRPLINKNPALFAQHFVEALFVLNNYSEHPCYAAAAVSGADSGGGVTMEGIDLAGDGTTQVRKRFLAYSTMIEQLTDENKITVTAKLAQEVLGAAVDGGLPIGVDSTAWRSGQGRDIDSNGKASRASSRAGAEQGGEVQLRAACKANAVVRDALTVMASAGMRVGGRAPTGEGEDPTDEMHSTLSGSAGLMAAKSKLLSKVALKHLMETVVPILVGLKHVLEKAHSSLLRELMFYFAALFRNHKAEVTNVLASEKDLVEEIAFDVTRFEKQEKERRSAKGSAALADNAGGTQAMGPPRTPGRRRSGAGTGAADGGANGRWRRSSGQDRRTPGKPRTPVAAVLQSALRTPFQNLENCSAVKLKGPRASTLGSTTSTLRSPGLARGIGCAPDRNEASKTPRHLRTPREAVAAALGHSPVAISSPLRMKNIELDGDSGIKPAGDEEKPVGRADVDLHIMADDVHHAAKRGRWARETPSTGSSGRGDDDENGESSDVDERAQSSEKAQEADDAPPKMSGRRVRRANHSRKTSRSNQMVNNNESIHRAERNNDLHHKGERENAGRGHNSAMMSRTSHKVAKGTALKTAEATKKSSAGLRRSSRKETCST